MFVFDDCQIASTPMSVVKGSNFRLLADHGHPGKSLSTEKHKIFWARSGERAIGLIRICRCATLPLGFWFLLSAEPDIHLLSETPKSPHVWSAALSQAKNDDDGMVCVNVYGLC